MWPLVLKIELFNYQGGGGGGEVDRTEGTVGFKTQSYMGRERMSKTREVLKIYTQPLLILKL